MLERQSKTIDSKEAENKALREEIKQRDETIRKYWAEISDTRSTLKIIQASQQHLEQQNALLKEQVKELTASNMELLKQMTELRESLRVPR
jgi:chromosome segregation ATPase